MNLASEIGRRLSPERKRSLRALRGYAVSLLHGRNLTRLALHYHSDKAGGHFYTKHYERHFAPLRRRPITLIEIGIGGNDDPRAGGASLRMWKAYFPRARIVGIDLYEKSWHQEGRIRTFQGSQADAGFLRRVVEEVGRPDIVIDDGSHRSEHVISSFQTLFPLLADDGIYVIEDLQTSYWTEYGGSEERMDDPQTSMGFIKSLIHGLNHAEMRRPDRPRGLFEEWIVGLHVYHNLAFIEKGRNDEPSYVY